MPRKRKTISNLVLLFGILESGFVLGTVGTFLGSRRKESPVKKARWIKLIGYFAIVHLVVFLVMAGRGYSAGLFLIIVSAGLGEILVVSIRSRATLRPRFLPAIVVPVYCVLAAVSMVFTLTASANLILFGYVVVAVLDAYSQITGQLWGRHPLAPAISPAKTIEGSVGGILCALTAAVLLGPFAGIRTEQALLVGVVICLFGMAGDLGASWYKRRCGIKDYSRLLPGQGGFIDRFNSFLAAAPALLFLFLSF